MIARLKADPVACHKANGVYVSPELDAEAQVAEDAEALRTRHDART